MNSRECLIGFFILNFLSFFILSCSSEEKGFFDLPKTVLRLDYSDIEGNGTGVLFESSYFTKRDADLDEAQVLEEEDFLLVTNFHVYCCRINGEPYSLQFEVGEQEKKEISLGEPFLADIKHDIVVFKLRLGENLEIFEEEFLKFQREIRPLNQSSYSTLNIGFSYMARRRYNLETKAILEGYSYLNYQYSSEEIYTFSRSIGFAVNFHRGMSGGLIVSKNRIEGIIKQTSTFGYLVGTVIDEVFSLLKNSSSYCEGADSCYRKALERIYADAEGGDHKSQFILAESFFSNEGGQLNFLDLICNRTDQGSSLDFCDDQSRMGEKAQSFFANAVRGGHPEVEFAYARQLEKPCRGRTHCEDVDDILEYYFSAAQKNHPIGEVVFRGVCSKYKDRGYCTQKSLGLQSRWVRSLAAFGHVYPQLVLIRCRPIDVGCNSDIWLERYCDPGQRGQRMDFEQYVSRSDGGSSLEELVESLNNSCRPSHPSRPSFPQV